VNHTLIEPALCSLASAITGVDAGLCVFQNAARPRHNGTLVTLSWVSIESVGTDEQEWTYAANADPLLEMTPTVQGPRAATLQLSIESTDQRPGYTAHALADKARTRLFWPSSLEALSDVDLALASIGNVVTADYKVDGRWLSRCTLDVRLNGIASEADLNGRTSYIATVEATATIRSPNGTALDIDIQPSLSG
jgi:hypothetical protein